MLQMRTEIQRTRLATRFMGPRQTGPARKKTTPLPTVPSPRTVPEKQVHRPALQKPVEARKDFSSRLERREVPGHHIYTKLFTTEDKKADEKKEKNGGASASARSIFRMKNPAQTPLQTVGGSHGPIPTSSHITGPRPFEPGRDSNIVLTDSQSEADSNKHEDERLASEDEPPLPTPPDGFVIPDSPPAPAAPAPRGSEVSPPKRQEPPPPRPKTRESPDDVDASRRERNPNEYERSASFRGGPSQSGRSRNRQSRRGRRDSRRDSRQNVRADSPLLRSKTFDYPDGGAKKDAGKRDRREKRARKKMILTVILVVGVLALAAAIVCFTWAAVSSMQKDTSADKLLFDGEKKSFLSPGANLSWSFVPTTYPFLSVSLSPPRDL